MAFTAGAYRSTKMRSRSAIRASTNKLNSSSEIDLSEETERMIATILIAKAHPEIALEILILKFYRTERAGMESSTKAQLGIYLSRLLERYSFSSFGGSLNNSIRLHFLHTNAVAAAFNQSKLSSVAPVVFMSISLVSNLSCPQWRQRICFPPAE